MEGLPSLLSLGSLLKLRDALMHPQSPQFHSNRNDSQSQQIEKFPRYVTQWWKYSCGTASPISRDALEPQKTRTGDRTPGHILERQFDTWVTVLKPVQS